MELRRDDLVRAAGDRTKRRADRLAGVEQDLRQAQAEALGRTGERLEGILDRLTVLDRHLDARLPDADRPPAGDARPGTGIAGDLEIRNQLRDEAVRVRYHLIIQREALGLARQGPVEQCYPVPGRRRVPEPADDRRRKA